MALRNVTDSKGEEDPTSRQDGQKTPEGRRSSALQSRIQHRGFVAPHRKLSCVIKLLSEGGDGHICETLPHLKTTQVLPASILAWRVCYCHSHHLYWPTGWNGGAGCMFVCGWPVLTLQDTQLETRMELSRVHTSAKAQQSALIQSKPDLINSKLM